jgi:hypothetical protein
VVNIAGDAQISVSPASLTFTPQNWDTPQTVTVSAVDDSVIEGAHTAVITHSVVSADTGYNGLAVADVSVSIEDNDTAGVVFSETSVNVTEGGATATYTVYLTGTPTSDVTLTIGGTGTQVTVNPNTLTFTPANHHQPQIITVTAVNDSVAEGSHTATLTHTLTTTDTNYAALPAQPSLTVTITDNDTVGVIITQSGGNTTVTEGGATDTYTIRLNSKPTANVTVNLSGTSQASVSPTTMTFTTTNWNTAKTATVTAVNDTLEEGNHTSSIAHSVTSSDTLYNGFTVASLTVNIIDNDVFNADAGSDQSHQIPHDGMVLGSETAYVTLNGSQSTGPITGYQWRRQNNSTILSTNSSHTLQLPVGTHTFVLTVTDGTRTDTDTVTIYVSLCIAPQCGTTE